MAYNQKIAAQIRSMLIDRELEVSEKEMFSGICFMVNEKMCICVAAEELLCRIGSAQVLKELEKGNTRNMMSNGRVMKDYVYVEDLAFDNPAKLQYWVNLCLAFNPLAKASKKKTK